MKPGIQAPERDRVVHVLCREADEEVKAMRSRLWWVACLATQGHGDCLAWTADKAYVSVPGPAAAIVLVDVLDSCYHRRSERIGLHRVGPAPQPLQHSGELVGPALHLGSTIELRVLARVRLSLPCPECVRARIAGSYFLSAMCEGERKMPFPLHPVTCSR